MNAIITKTLRESAFRGMAVWQATFNLPVRVVLLPFLLRWRRPRDGLCLGVRACRDLLQPVHLRFFHKSRQVFLGLRFKKKKKKNKNIKS